MRILAVTAGIATIAVLAAPARAHWTPNDLVHLRRHAVNLAWCGGTEKWCPSGSAAWAVAGCEAGPSRSPWARNGQYLGMFQMGDWARARYGHAWNSWGQARAAHRYWLHAGWAPWTCAAFVLTGWSWNPPDSRHA